MVEKIDAQKHRAEMMKDVKVILSGDHLAKPEVKAKAAVEPKADVKAPAKTVKKKAAKPKAKS